MGGSVSSIPVFRKRSESLGSNPAMGGQRGVTFAPRPEFLNEGADALLVAVELVSNNENSGNDKGSPRRLRSASCHVLSSPSSSAIASSCGTIYEEVAPSSTSCMDE